MLLNYPPERTAERIEKFVATNSIKTLNIAGSRASGEPLAYTLQAITHFLKGSNKTWYSMILIHTIAYHTIPYA